MKKYRIIEVQEPLGWYYAKGLAEEPPKEVDFSSPSMILQERKSIFHKWKTIKHIDSILEAEYIIYNEKAAKAKPIKRVIGKL